VVGAELLVYERGARFEGRLDVDDSGEVLVVDLDQAERLLGRARVGGQHDRHPVADVVDLADGERRVVGDLDVLGDRPAAGQPDRELARQVHAGENRDHPRQRAGGPGVDPADTGVGERAAQHRHVERARRRDVVGPGGPAGDQRGVLAAGHALPDEGRSLGDLGHVARLLARSAFRRIRPE
jgi:hypothetical protein